MKQPPPPPPPPLPPPEPEAELDWLASAEELEAEFDWLASPEELELPEPLPPLPPLPLDAPDGSEPAARNTSPSLLPITKSLRLLLSQSTTKGAALELTTIGPPWPDSGAPLAKAGAASVPVLRNR
jgi:hypothetical protein